MLDGLDEDDAVVEDDGVVDDEADRGSKSRRKFYNDVRTCVSYESIF